MKRLIVGIFVGMAIGIMVGGYLHRAQVYYVSSVEPAIHKELGYHRVHVIRRLTGAR